MRNELFKTVNEDGMTAEEVKHLVDAFLIRAERYRKLDRYYLTKNDAIMKRQMDKSNKPNNKVPNAFAKYITDMLTGYFMGVPVVYGVDADGSDKLLQTFQDNFDYNDEQSENYSIAKCMSVCGIAYELLYIDEDGQVRFKKCDADEMFCIYDMSIECRMLYAVRTYSYTDYNGKVTRWSEVYDKYNVNIYIDDEHGFRFLESKAHPFGDVPVIVYMNNEDALGDFEPVIANIDAYDRAQSNTLNDMDNFSDAYLKIRNMSGTDDTDLDKMREEKAIFVDDDGDVDWLVKNINDAWVENMKTRLQNDIHKFSGTPDMSDENFGSNLSGVSLRYKLIAMEQIRATKERYFKKGLQRRIELMCNVPYFNKSGEDYRTITMKFNNTLPQNVLEIAQIISYLAEYLSDETLLSLLPFVEDPAEEIKKKEQEQEEKVDRNMTNVLNYADNHSNNGDVANDGV